MRPGPEVVGCKCPAPLFGAPAGREPAGENKTTITLKIKRSKENQINKKQQT